MQLGLSICQIYRAGSSGLMSLDLAAGSLAYTISDDQIPITMPDRPTDLTNGISLDISTTPEDAKPKGPIAVKPLDLEKLHGHKSGGRFKVQPTKVSDSMTYSPISMDVQNSAANSQHATNSAMQYPLSTTSPSSTQTDNAVTVSTSNSNTPIASTEQCLQINIETSDAARKKVRFPDGRALIKGFAHAPNPWYNGELVFIASFLLEEVLSRHQHHLAQFHP